VVFIISVFFIRKDILSSQHTPTLLGISIPKKSTNEFSISSFSLPFTQQAGGEKVSLVALDIFRFL
jgi:hypothetical protein